MKIAIFGDSYADCNHLNHVPYKDQAWPNVLAKDYEVDNFAVGSSGLEYSAMMLNQSDKVAQDAYDRIIFIASDVRRMYLHPDWHNKHARQHYFLPEAFGKFSNDEVRKTTLNYFKYFMHDPILEYRNQLIIKDLRERFADNILLLKCYGQFNGPISNLFDNDMPLYDITSYEDDILNPDLVQHKKWQDCKMNHLTLPHHTLLCEKIKKWISTGTFSLEKSDLQKVSRETSTEYAFYNYSYK